MRLINADRLKEVFSRNVVGGNAYFDLIDSAPTVEAIPKSEYEARLKADLKAILVELQMKIDEIPINANTSESFRLGQAIAYDKCEKLIQQKINEVAVSSGTRKNSKKLEKDFGELDCISRVDAIKAMQDKAKELKNEDTINGLCGAVAILYDMPSVTPIRPKGHWIGSRRVGCGFGEFKEYIVPLKDGFVTDSCHCSECGEWLTGSDEYQCSGNFCPNCGADMRGNTKLKGEPIEGNNESYNCENWIP